MRRGAALLTLAASSCQMSLDSDPSRVDDVRVLAMQAIPPEAEPEQDVLLTALVAVAPGSEAPSTIRFGFCTQRRAVAENNSVAPDCLEPDSEWQQAIGRAGIAESVTATVPSPACERFGSEPPASEPGEPPLRPADPDASGGYYQPVLLGLDDEITVGHVRIRCALPSAPVDIVREYNERYDRNENPTLLRLESTETRISRGDVVRLQAELDPNSRERYVVYERKTTELVERREQLTVSWFASDGRFGNSRSAPSGRSTIISNEWTAPSTPGEQRIWAVLRDDRGGVSFQELTLDVE